MKDVIIIGQGPAGLCAAIFSARADLKTLVIGDPDKSQLVYAKHVQNYPGFIKSIDGKDLQKLFTDQAKSFNAEFLNNEVVNIIREGKNFIVKTADSAKFDCKAVVIAAGLPIPWSGIRGEKELLNKGVHTCPSCDGPVYKNKKVAIIGNGNHAVEDALILSAFTKDVTIIAHADKFDLTKKSEEDLKKNKIKKKVGKVKELKKEKNISVFYQDGSKDTFDGVFLACGSAGSTAFAQKLGVLMKDNLIIVDEDGMTNIKGVFAAGNCMSGCRQIAKNVGDGCNAGIGMIRYLKSSAYVDYGK